MINCKSQVKNCVLVCWVGMFSFVANAQIADKITVINDQMTNPAPSSFSREVRFHFKWNSNIGVPNVGAPGIGTYSALMTIAPWSDNTASKHHQLNFNEEGLYWRKGLFGSSWEPWRKIITAESNGRILSGTTTTAQSASGLVLGWDQNAIEFVNSDYGVGYGAKIYGVDQGNGLTSFRIAVRGNSTSWADALFIRADSQGGGRLGFVGMGTNDPQARMHVHEEALLGSQANNSVMLSRVSGRAPNHFANDVWLLRATSESHGQWWNAKLHDGISIDNFHMTPGSNTLTWWERYPNKNIQSWGSANQTYMTLQEGNLGIGTTTPDSKLTVKGDIHTREVKVDLNGAVGPDYVFEPDYNLLSLSELETYITQNKHLPEVPSAKEMEKEGLNLKEMNLLLLKKVEELTLHLIEQNKKIDEQHQTIQRQNDRLIKLESSK